MNDPGMSNVATSLFYLASITQDRNTDFAVAVGELPPPCLVYPPLSTISTPVALELSAYLLLR